MFQLFRLFYYLYTIYTTILKFDHFADVPYISYPLFGFDLMSLHCKSFWSIYCAIVIFVLSISFDFMDFHPFARGIVFLLNQTHVLSH
jgi:hypothetical protein